MAQQTFQDKWADTAQQMIDEEIERLKGILAAGNLLDHADYKFHAGMIAGLVKTSEFLTQSLADIQKT